MRTLPGLLILAACTSAAPPASDYETKTVEGWTVHVARPLLERLRSPYEPDRPVAENGPAKQISAEEVAVTVVRGVHAVEVGDTQRP
jgi:hypothetical protein